MSPIAIQGKRQAFLAQGNNCGWNKQVHLKRLRPKRYLNAIPGISLPKNLNRKSLDLEEFCEISRFNRILEAKTSFEHLKPITSFVFPMMQLSEAAKH